MTPVLFVTPGSCGLGSLIALEWLGTPYRVCRLSVADHTSPAYLRLTPLGEVPAMLSADGVLTESFAIFHHLGRRDRSGRLVPKDPAGLDALNRALGYLISTLHPAFRPVFHADRFALTDVGIREARDAAIARLPREFAYVDRLIAPTGWLVGRQPTVADAYFLGLARWGDKFVERSDYPNIERLRKRLGEDPSVAFALSAEGGKPTTSVGSFAGMVDLAEVSSMIDEMELTT